MDIVLKVSGMVILKKNAFKGFPIAKNEINSQKLPKSKQPHKVTPHLKDLDKSYPKIAITTVFDTAIFKKTVFQAFQVWSFSSQQHTEKNIW